MQSLGRSGAWKVAQRHQARAGALSSRLQKISARTLRTYNIRHSPHYAKWMGSPVHYYPEDVNIVHFMLQMGGFLGLQTCFYYWLECKCQRYIAVVSQTRPEWQSSFTSDLEFNPPLWIHEIPGAIPYIRTVEIEDSWDRVEKIRGKHWSDDYEYTKPWEVDDGQYANRSPKHKSYIG